MRETWTVLRIVPTRETWPVRLNVDDRNAASASARAAAALESGSDVEAEGAGVEEGGMSLAGRARRDRREEEENGRQ